MTATNWKRGDTLVADDLDAAFGNSVDKRGDTMVGLLTLASDPVGPFDAATKQYIDNKMSPTGPYILKAGDTMLGALTLAGNPASALQAAPKQYVDGLASSILPVMDGTAAIGVGTTWARNDHVHASDTSRAPLASPALTGTPTAPTPANTDSSTNIATTAFVRTGTTTNNNAAAGQIGEFVTSTGSSIALTNGVVINMTTISLTAGDWDVVGSVVFQPAATTTVASLSVGTSVTSAALPALANGLVSITTTFNVGTNQTLASGMQRISIAATTTVYMVAAASFATSTMNAVGYIRARRIR